MIDKHADWIMSMTEEQYDMFLEDIDDAYNEGRKSARVGLILSVGLALGVIWGVLWVMK